MYVKRGVIRRTPCIYCGEKKVEGHHEDYSKPLEVYWVCRPHHVELTQGVIMLPNPRPPYPEQLWKYRRRTLHVEHSPQTVVK